MPKKALTNKKTAHLNGTASALIAPFDAQIFKSAHVDIQHFNPAAWASAAPEADLRLLADLRPKSGKKHSKKQKQHKKYSKKHLRIPKKILRKVLRKISFSQPQPTMLKARFLSRMLHPAHSTEMRYRFVQSVPA
jgi:hypothetical protein